MKKHHPVVITSLTVLLLLTSAYSIRPSVASSEEIQVAALPLKANTSDDKAETFPVEFMNREIFTVRTGFMGFTKKERALGIKNRIEMAIEQGGDDHVSIRPTPEGGRFIELNGIAVFQVKPEDVDSLIGESIDDAAKNAAENLRIAVSEFRQQGNTSVLAKGIGLTVFASILFYLTCLVVFWGEKKIIARLRNWLVNHQNKLALAIQPHQAIKAFIVLTNFSKWAIVAIAAYQWAAFCLRLFPFTRPWGEKLHGYLVGTVQEIVLAMVSALPGLLVVLLIVLLTRFASQMLKAFFAKIESGDVSVAWMDEDTAKPTRKLTQGLLWLFALAMAYPYFPGSNTEAFRGLSVLVGIMLSIGGSGVVGQAASGLIMIYSRVLREGEYVKIGEIEGLVTMVGIFSTKVRTSNGEEVNVPNSLIGNSMTVNSSRLAEGEGLMVHTTVTIGYNTPWRQVHGMLLQAAGNAPGLRSDPKPYVAQTALSDFYVEYRLTAQVEKPELRRTAMTALHANIQDVFNEYGVQIMSPHYENDPAEKVWVPKEQWFDAPSEEGVDERAV